MLPPQSPAAGRYLEALEQFKVKKEADEVPPPTTGQLIPSMGLNPI